MSCDDDCGKVKLEVSLDIILCCVKLMRLFNSWLSLIRVYVTKDWYACLIDQHILRGYLMVGLGT